MRALTLFSMALTAACGASKTPAPTVVFDGAPFATLAARGWMHHSGELALPTDGDRVVVERHTVRPSELVDCADDHCIFAVLPSPVVLDGFALSVDGKARGEVRGATRDQALSALVLLATYQPPGPVTAQLFCMRLGATTTLEVSALPDGRLVDGAACSWPRSCVPAVIGAWTPTEITLGDARVAMADAVEGGRVRAEPGEDWVLRVTREGDLAAQGRWAAEASGGSLHATRPKDADWTSPQALAAAVAVAYELTHASEPGPPPPPPPPPPG